MKLTPEKIVALKALAEDADISGIDSLTARLDLLHEKDAERIQVFKEYVPTLIADLEEAQHMNANQIHRIKYLENASQTNACEAIALASELATVRKELDSERLISKQLAEHVDHWRANHESVVKKLRLFTQREDLPIDRLPAYEYVVELEKKLAETNNRERLISKNLDFERELHAKTETELAATRKKLAESERRYSESVGGFKRDLQQKLDDQRSKSVRLKAKLAEAQSRDGSIAPVAAIKFSLKTDCGDQFLRCWVEGSFDAIRSEWPEAPEAVFIGADPLHPNTQQTGTAALDAAIAEAIADEKRNPWKQAIINELAVSHVLHTDHETDPVRALAALVDYECKVALDPAVSKEAQELIEPYRKDAERLDLLGKLCKEIPLRPNAFCSEIAPDTRLRYDFPTLVSYDSVGNQISLRDAIDAAIAAAKGDSE